MLRVVDVIKVVEVVRVVKVVRVVEKMGWLRLGFGQGGSGCSGKLAPCMCRETHCTCASSPCIFKLV